MRRWIAAATLAMTLACSLDTTTSVPNNAAIAGKYPLHTINGSGLPFTFVNGADSLTVLTDTLFVSVDGSWLESFTYRQIVGGDVSNGGQVDGGLWFSDGNQVEFDSSISATVVYLGTYADGTLTLSDGSSTQVFVR